MFIRSPHKRSARQLAHRCALLMLALALPQAARAGTLETNAAYVINLGGINIATANVRFTEGAGSYAVDIAANVSGVGTLVAEGSAQADSRGVTGDHRLTARDFNVTTRANGKDFSVAVQYAAGNATAFRVEPPVVNTLGRVPIERQDLQGVTDPVGAFILKGGELGPQLCQRTLKIFTGMERYDIDMRFGAMQTATSARTGYQGPVALCKLRYVPVSGHYKSSQMTRYLAASKKILIWYAPLEGTEYFIPYRVLMATDAGDLSMVLTELE